MLFFLFCLLPIIAYSEYYISICGCFQNEARYLKEWIEYHRLIGVEHFYLYNNDSEDNYKEVLEPYIKKGIVDLTEWPSLNKDDNFMPHLLVAYNDCITKHREETQWLALIDIDEFIVPVETYFLTDFLSDFDDDPTIGGVKMNWQLYGTSHIAKLPKKKLVIENFILKAPWDYDSPDLPNNWVTKSIVKPQAVNFMATLHKAAYHKGIHSIPHSGRGAKQPVDISGIRLNHYWTRDENFFYNVKIGRRLRFRPPEYQQIMIDKLSDLNQVEDRIMDRYVPELKKRMKNH